MYVEPQTVFRWRFSKSQTNDLYSNKLAMIEVVVDINKKKLQVLETRLNPLSTKVVYEVKY